jgi:hypothetical protein
MQKVKNIIAGIVIILFVYGCAPTAKTTSDMSATPEEIYTFEISPESTSREIQDSKPDILKGFPFISAHPTSSFMGKFPPEFYSANKLKWSAEYITFADFWNLRHDQHFYDVIYMNPMWIGDLILRENDLMKNIAYSYNIPSEKIRILDRWIRDGGVLWIESAIYISSYDYKLNKFDDEKLSALIDKIRAMTLFGNSLNVHTMTAERIDEFNIKKLSMAVIPDKEAAGTKEIHQDVHSLLLEQSDYIGIYFSIDGVPLIQSGDTVYASYAKYGKGKIITLTPFDFKHTHYDGEILRLDLLSWALNDRT